MKHQKAYEAIQAAVAALHKKLGDSYQTCYLYGSLAQNFYQAGQSDINLIFVFDNKTSIHDIRGAFLPVWETYGAVLKTVPVITSEATFQRHMRLQPAFARHIAKHGKQVKGSKRILHHTSPLANKEQLARLTAKAMEASLALTPGLIRNQDEQSKPYQQLRSLVRQIRKAEVSNNETPKALFAELQQLLQRKTEEIYQLQETEPIPGSTAFLNPASLKQDPPPYNLPGLSSIYQKMDYLVLALESAAAINAAKWSNLEQEVQGEYGGIQITTPMQMRLIIKYEMPLEHVLRSYRHQWGKQPLQNLEPESWRILRDAARIADRIALFDLPAAYLTTSENAHTEEALHKIVHDFQNKLLNIRLQNELLLRLGTTTPPEEMPEPLPGREEALPKRISAIFDHLNWWSNYYEAQMLQTSMSNE